MVEFLDTATNQTISYAIDKKVLRLLEHKIKPYINQSDNDYVMIVTGAEGSGKSVFSHQLGKYVDPSLTLDRICMTADEFKKAIVNAKKGQCVIFDEAVTGLSSGESITRIGKLLKSMMMQMRQKNLFVIVIIPVIFELNRYSVLSRAKFLFHTFESKGSKGYAIGFNKKQMRQLYLKGKKTYSYNVWSSFKCRFYGKYVVDEQEYRKKKEQALFLFDEDNKEMEYTTEGKKYMLARDIAIHYLSMIGNTPKDISEKFSLKGYTLSEREIEKVIQGQERLESLNPNIDSSIISL
jgi:hypothetical protein